MYWIYFQLIFSTFDGFIRTFPVVMYGCESWTVKKAECRRLDVLNCGVEEDSWDSLGLQGYPTSPFWRRPALGFLWREWATDSLKANILIRENSPGPERGSPSPNQPEDFEPCKGEKLSAKETVALSPAWKLIYQHWRGWVKLVGEAGGTRVLNWMLFGPYHLILHK